MPPLPKLPTLKPHSHLLTFSHLEFLGVPRLRPDPVGALVGAWREQFPHERK